MNAPICLRRVAAICSLLITVLAASSLAATREYDAEAAAVPQIDSITFGGTWSEVETFSVTIGNSTLTVTTGSDTTTLSQLADLCKRAINATTIDENKVGFELRSAAGQLLPEFRDVEAVIHPENSSQVLVRSKVAGVPFGTPGGNLTVAEGSLSGTITRASVQAATGPWHWNNATNWSSNTAPVNGDLAVFRGTAYGPKFGLPNGSLEVTVHVYNDFTGTIGLPLVNTANGLSYSEYRQRYARLDDAGSGTDIAHRFGLGAGGAGSPLINLKQTGVKSTPVVYSTGTPATGQYALNIVSTAANSTITVQQGSVNTGDQDGGTANWLHQNYGHTSSQGSDVNARFSGAPQTVTVSGGTVLLQDVTGTVTALNVHGGTVRVENSAATFTALTINTGILRWAAAATIGTLTLRDGGTFDASTTLESFTVQDTVVQGACTLLDPYQRITFDNVITIEGASLNEQTFDFGSGFTLHPYQ